MITLADALVDLAQCNRIDCFGNAEVYTLAENKKEMAGMEKKKRNLSSYVASWKVYVEWRRQETEPNLPEEKYNWQSYEKSITLTGLATHIAELSGK